MTVASTLLTIDMVTQEAVMIFKNSNAFMQNISTQYDSSFGVTGAKIGQALRIRLPLDYTVTDGPGLSAQDSVEQSVSLPLATQRHAWDHGQARNIGVIALRVPAPPASTVGDLVHGRRILGSFNVGFSSSDSARTSFLSGGRRIFFFSRKSRISPARHIDWNAFSCGERRCSAVQSACFIARGTSFQCAGQTSAPGPSFSRSQLSRVQTFGSARFLTGAPASALTDGPSTAAPSRSQP